MTPDQLRDFLTGPERNRWFNSDVMDLYVRKAVHTCNDEPIRCVDIANINIFKTNQKIFTNWYPEIRQTAINFGAEAVYFESILNESFGNKLARMGMQRYETGLTLNYFDFL